MHTNEIDVSYLRLALGKESDQERRDLIVFLNDETSSRWLEQAVDLYQGEYLQNMYYDWLFPERRRISKEYLGMLRQLAKYHLN